MTVMDKIMRIMIFITMIQNDDGHDYVDNIIMII